MLVWLLFYTEDFLPRETPRPFTDCKEPHGLISTQVNYWLANLLGSTHSFLFQNVMLPDLSHKFYGNSHLKATVLHGNITTQETTLIVRRCLVEQRISTPGMRLHW